MDEYLLFSREDTYDMVRTYYRKHEDREVTPSIGIGRVISAKKPAPPRITVHYELQEVVNDSGVSKILRQVISEDEFLKAVSTTLEETGFIAEGVELQKGPASHQIFTGIKVRGQKISKDKTL